MTPRIREERAMHCIYTALIFAATFEYLWRSNGFEDLLENCLTGRSLVEMVSLHVGL